jgi:hypothetical protein
MSAPQPQGTLQPPLAALVGNISNWLTQVGFPVRDFTTQFSPKAGRSISVSAPGAVYLSPRYAPWFDSAAQRLGTRGKLNAKQVEAIHGLLHESLHQMRYGRETRRRT